MLDPDGQTFWHTGEYSISNNPATRIYSFKLATTTGIEEHQNEALLSVYQVDNYLNVKANNLPSNAEILVDLFDITGKQISGKKITTSSNTLETTINIDGLAKGVYLVRIGNINFQEVVKVMVN
jgi:hypothetical protein